MKRLFIFVLLFAISATCLKAYELTDWFSVIPKRYNILGLSFGGVDAEFRLHGKDWKSCSLLKFNELDFIQKKDVMDISGKWNTVAGPLKVNGMITKKNPFEIMLNFTASSDKPIESESCYLKLSFPCKYYRGKSLTVDKQEIKLPEKFTKRRLNNSISAREISIPTRSGRIVIKGDLQCYLLDLSKTKNEYSLRMLLRKEQKLDQTRLNLRFDISIDDLGFHPLDFRKQANMGFRDQVAEDKKGGWTDQGENDLRSLTPGIKHFDGVRYNIIDSAKNNGKSCLLFANPARPYFLKKVKIPVDHISGDCIYILHALAWASGRERQIGNIVIQYADGTTDPIKVIETKDASDWWKPYRCDNGSLCWTGQNKFSDIGLYQSRFQIQHKPITGVSLQTSQNAVWGVVGITVGKKVPLGSFDNHAFRILKSAQWQPIHVSNQIVPGSIMDLSHIHRKRAADRKISIENGHFVYQNTHERVRFLGSNLVGRACFPSKTAADNLAEQLWKMGYNSVRLHHYDGYLVDYQKSHNILNKKLIDKMDYLISAMKKRGIYVFIDLFSIRRLAQNVTEKLGLKRHPSNDQYKNMMALFPEVFDDWKDFASLIMNHVNPYTGFAWKDDPAIYAVCLTNENCIGAYLKDIEQPLINKMFKKDFKAWSKKHQSENGKYNKYTNELQRGIFNKTKAYVRDLGSNALLTDLNHRAYLPLPFSRQLFDFIDIHSYWDHPSYPVHKFTFPQVYKNNSSLKNFAEWPLNVATGRQFGKPFTVSEYNYTASNVYRSEMGLLMGAYASLQDWDALYSFQFAKTQDQVTSPEKITKFNICSDPVRLLGERIIALLFLRGDVAPAKNGIAFLASKECLELKEAFSIQNKFMDNRFTRLGLISRLGTVVAESNKIDLPAGITHCVGLPEQSPISLPPSVTYMPLNKIIDKGLDDVLNSPKTTKSGIYRSETGEIELNGKTPSFRFVSPRSEGFIMPEGISVTGNAVKVKNMSGYASVFVASHNQHSISESRRLLVFHLTDVQNTKATFDSDEMKVWLKSGGLPLLVHRGIARISIKTQMADTASIWAVDITGKRIKKMPVSRKNGAISFSAETIQGKETFLAYEVAEK